MIGLGVDLDVVDASPAGGDSTLDVAQLVAGVQTDGVDEVLPVDLEGTQRLGLAAGVSERSHEQALATVPQRMLDDMHLEVLHSPLGLASRQPELGAVLDRVGSDFVEAIGLTDGPGFVAELLQRRAVPALERTRDPFGRAGGAPQLLSGECRVDIRDQPIATNRGTQHVIAEVATQTGDRGPQRTRRDVEHLAQEAGADRSGRMQGQKGEQPALARTREVGHVAVGSQEPHGSEQPDHRRSLLRYHRSSMTALSRGSPSWKLSETARRCLVVDADLCAHQGTDWHGSETTPVDVSGKTQKLRTAAEDGDRSIAIFPFVRVTTVGDVRLFDMGGDDNRFSDAVVSDLNELLTELEAGEGPRALVIRASGKVWSNGLDLDFMAAHPEEMWRYLADIELLFARLMGLGVPTVAAITGHAFGAGAMATLCHDASVMRSDRGYWCLPEVDLGMALSPGEHLLVAQRLAPSTRNRALTTGHRFGAEEAMAAGIVDEVRLGDEVVERAIEIAAERAPNAGDTLRSLKQGMYGAAADALREDAAGALAYHRDEASR